MPTERFWYGIMMFLSSLQSSHSMVFRRMFAVDMKEKNAQEVVLKEVEEEAFLKVVQFMYSGKIRINPDILIPTLKIVDQVGQELIHLMIVRSGPFEKFGRRLWQVVFKLG